MSKKSERKGTKMQNGKGIIPPSPPGEGERLPVGWNFLKSPTYRRCDPGMLEHVPPAFSIEQAIPLWELLHRFMHSEKPGDVYVGDVDPVFEAEQELYLMLTYRLTLDARIGRIQISEEPA